jgi:zinc transporter ZupT
MTPLAFALAAGARQRGGALAVVRHLRRELRLIDAVSPFGAGFMLAVAVLGVLPEVLRQGTSGAVYVLRRLPGGAPGPARLTPISTFGEETHRLSRAGGVSAVLGLTLHTFFDGVAIASGFLVSDQLGVLLFLAVLLATSCRRG